MTELLPRGDAAPGRPFPRPALPATARLAVDRALRDAAELGAGWPRPCSGRRSRTGWWLSYADLCGSAALDEWVDSAAALLGADRTVAAALATSTLTAAVAFPRVVPAVTAGRLVRPHAPELWVQVDPASGDVPTLALGAPGLAVLPDDPLAGTSGVLVAADRVDLFRLLTDDLVDTLGPLLDRLGPLSRRGARALWATAADGLAAAFLVAGEASCDPTAARRLADETLAAAPAPLRQRISWLSVSAAGREHLTKRRSVCCLAYRAERWAKQYCSTCPMITELETRRRLTEWLVTESDPEIGTAGD